LEGQVIHIEPSYMARPDFSWGWFFVKLALFGIAFLVFGPFVIAVALALTIASSLLIPFGRRRGPGFFSSIASQVVGFFLTSKLLGPKADVPVRDVRLRDMSGNEHLIRLKGELIAGNMNVGDEVAIEGYDRMGTLTAVRGLNKRTRSEIRIKRR
jgi:hypothetical protein